MRKIPEVNITSGTNAVWTGTYIYLNVIIVIDAI